MSTKEMRKLIESIVMVSEEENPSERLSEIKEEIKELMSEVQSLISNNERIWGRAKGYWYAHIISALDKEHSYMGSSMVTMQDTIDELGGGGDIEGAVDWVETLMNEKGVSVEDAVDEVSNGTGINYNELMAEVQQAMGRTQNS